MQEAGYAQDVEDVVWIPEVASRTPPIVAHVNKTELQLRQANGEMRRVKRRGRSG